jgi:hypothetical protein
MGTGRYRQATVVTGKRSIGCRYRHGYGHFSGYVKDWLITGDVD